MNKNNIGIATKLLASDAFFMVNKVIAHALSLNAAILLAELLYKKRYYVEKDGLGEEGEFFITNDELMYNCALTKKYFLSARASLIDAGLIMKENIGVSNKTHYLVFEDNILSFIENNPFPLFLQKKKARKQVFLVKNRPVSPATTTKHDVTLAVGTMLPKQTSRCYPTYTNKVSKKKISTEKTLNVLARSISSKVSDGPVLYDNTINTKAVLYDSSKDIDIIDLSDSKDLGKSVKELSKKDRGGYLMMTKEYSDSVDLFMDNVQNSVYGDVEFDTIDYFLEDLIDDVKESKMDSDIKLFDFFTAAMGMTLFWSKSTYDTRFIKKLVKYDIETPRIADRMLRNAYNMLQGEKKMRFGQFFVGLNQINKSLE